MINIPTRFAYNLAGCLFLFVLLLNNMQKRPGKSVTYNLYCVISECYDAALGYSLILKEILHSGTD